MTTTKRLERDKAIVSHGWKLLAIFPAAAIRTPLALYLALRRLEAQAERLGLRSCNGPEWPSEEAQEAAEERILKHVDELLGFVEAGIPVFLNGDPRGYALKIESEYVREHELDIDRDWGGYGILAPDFTE